jgi:5-methylcytosine-specific restriction endonuclease McrBC GTP-binding regulatory subunit McrB
VKACIWGQLQGHTDIKCENVNYTKRVEPQIMWKNDDSSWQFTNNEIEDLIEESLVLINDYNQIEDIRVDDKSIRRYEFVTFHQAFSYEDFIEGIKPVMDDESDDIRYEIKSGVFKQICKRAENDPTNKYALFIDEINRGNVANIFGELITLIEPDKREGMDNALSVKLPYSKTIFSVPNNLDIIGTMNTADRSVEALDTALRRRFEFEEMLPDSSLLSDIRCEGIDLERLLNTINGRIEKLLDKDHQIGHSYFMNSNNTLSTNNLQSIFKNKIMPLLQEYFYGDFGKIGLVLGNSFIKENKEKTIFSKFTYDDYDLIDERKVYQLSDINKLKATDFKSIYETSE